jgi:hypothetical protein
VHQNAPLAKNDIKREPQTEAEKLRKRSFWELPKRRDPLKSFPIVTGKTMGKLFAFFRISFQSFPDHQQNPVDLTYL